MFENINEFISQLITEKDNEEIEDNVLLRKELNHKNIKIRKYYRSKENMINYFGAYFFTLLFPLFILIMPFKDTKIFHIIDDLFLDNKLVELFFYLKAKKIINIKEVIENNKKYTVKTYLDGKIVYEYKNKIHREKDTASFYPAKYFPFLKYKRKYFIHGKQVSVNQFEIAKIQHNFKEF